MCIISATRSHWHTASMRAVPQGPDSDATRAGTAASRPGPVP